MEVFAPNVKIEMEVQPGNAEIERGTNCLVTVRFRGPVPDQVVLVRTTADVESQQPTLVAMQRSLNDPVFAGYLNKVSTDTDYKIEFDGGRSDLFHLKVFDFPALLRSDAEIAPPAYANQENRLVKDTRRISVPEGTTLTWICNVNKPLESVELVDDQGSITAMTSDPTASSSSEVGLVYRATITLDASQKWKVRLKDHEGRSARIEETLTATVLPNKPPEVKAEKVTDVTVSPLEELSIQAKVRDDYSLVRAGVQFNLAGGESIEKTLYEQTKSAEKEPTADAAVVQGKPSKMRDVSITQLLDFEAMGSEPDQFLSYYFWAEDIDQAGEVRRVDGEIYFADVRPFEEIFREGETPQGDQPPPPGQSSPQAQQADEIAELQKKIMSGTWNVIRSQKSPQLSQKSADDVEVLSDSQSEAIEMAAKLEEKIQDAQSRKHLDVAVESMGSAIKQLDESVSTKEVSHLKSALRFEQSAYEGLLRLRAREHQIVQSKKSSSKSSSSSKKNRQKQIDQLELKDDSERYETEREATPESEETDREMRQVMSRLDEIARRQEDINRQLKDIETALQAAQNEEEKKELEEQLKRLRENQEELLRDTDELMNRMQESQQSSESSEKSSQPNEAMEQAQQQVAEAREEIRQSTESLSQSKPSPAQALSSGTRAEKKLSETRDQLREQSAQRFEETMKNMLNRARELEKDQEQLASAALGKNTDESKAKADADVDADAEQQGGLRPGTDGQPQETPSPEEAWKEQRDKLNDLLQDMQDTVTEAEPSEPLLAEKLYETFRETKQRDIENQLDLVPRLVERGLAAPVEQTLEEIETGIQELREGVEQAAESVLGSEVDSLRRALGELEELEKQLQEEIASRNPSNADRANADPSNSNRDPSANQNREAAEANENQSQKSSSENEDSKSDSEGASETANSKKKSEGSSEKTGQKGKGKSAPGEQSGKGSPSDSKSGQPGTPSEGGKQSASKSSQKGSPSANPNQSSKNVARSNGDESRSQVQSGNPSGSSSLADVLERSSAPITGNDFGEWSDALRDVEESVRDPEMRGAAAGIRQAARELHRDYIRHSKEPQWDLVRELVAKPLAQLRETVQAELLRKSADRNAVVPIDRDPVPTVFEQQLRRYYENLGSQKDNSR
jgi:hypothetical protein